MSAKELTAVVGELADVLQEVDDAALRGIEERINLARRVFVAGAGRSGLMMRAFAMRLMHLGLRVHVIGEVTTPPIEAGDLLFIGSGSGETESLCSMARRARHLGAGLALVTIAASSTIGRLADTVVRIDASSPKVRPALGATVRTSIQPMGSLFEQALLLLLDTVVLRLAAARGTSPDEMFSRHANVE
jgi:6-phospho-3-hexuloisomerase